MSIGAGHVYKTMKRIVLFSLSVLFLSSFAKAEVVEMPISHPNNNLEEMAINAVVLDLQMQQREFMLASFISENKNRFFPLDLQMISSRIQQLSDDQLVFVLNNQYKDPTTSLIVSVLGGVLGIDRFYIGDVGLGVAKLLTGGGVGVWWIVDMFIIQNRTKKVNMKDFTKEFTTISQLIPASQQ